MPDEAEREPTDHLRVACLTGFYLRFYCHGKLMEVIHNDDATFKLTCDLCGKGPTGEVGGSDP